LPGQSLCVTYANADTNTDADTYHTNTDAYACCHPDSKTASNATAAPNTASASLTPRGDTLKVTNLQRY
jgi:hypothetical protein